MRKFMVGSLVVFAMISFAVPIFASQMAEDSPSSRPVAADEPTTQAATTQPTSQPATQPVTRQIVATDRRIQARVEAVVEEFGLTEEHGRILLRFPDVSDDILREFAKYIKKHGVLRARRNSTGHWTLSDKRVIGTLNDGTQVWEETLPTIPPLPKQE